jgi:hypothetical protein
MSRVLAARSSDQSSNAATTIAGHRARTSSAMRAGFCEVATMLVRARAASDATSAAM